MINRLPRKEIRKRNPSGHSGKISDYRLEIPGFPILRKIFVLLCIGCAHVTLHAQAFDASSLVKASLLASSRDLTKPISIGVKLNIAKGWHLYWKNPGDSGLPVDVQWDLPRGFTMSETQFPVPKKFEAKGSVTYGYENEVMLLCTLIASENYSGSEVVITANVDFLACKESCKRGVKKISLQVGKLTAQELRSNRAIIKTAERKLPSLMETNSSRLSGLLRRNEQTSQIEFSFATNAPTPTTDFFPEATDDYLRDHSKIRSTGGTITIPMQFVYDSVRSRTMRGLLLFGKKVYQVSVAMEGDGR